LNRLQRRSFEIFFLFFEILAAIWIILDVSVLIARQA